MSAWLKRLALRFLAWLALDDLVRTAEARTLTAERDAVTDAPTTIAETGKRLREGHF